MDIYIYIYTDIRMGRDRKGACATRICQVWGALPQFYGIQRLGLKGEYSYRMA